MPNIISGGVKGDVNNVLLIDIQKCFLLSLFIIENILIKSIFVFDIKTW